MVTATKRSQLLLLAKRHLKLAKSSQDPGCHIIEVESILKTIGATWHDLGIGQEQVEVLKKKAEISDARFQLQKLLTGSRQAAENIKNFISGLPPDIRDELGFSPAPTPSAPLEAKNVIFERGLK